MNKMDLFFEPVINDTIDTLNVAFTLFFLFSLASGDIYGNTRHMYIDKKGDDKMKNYLRNWDAVN